MLRPFRLAWLYFKLGSLTELQYRANFFIQLLQTTVAAGRRSSCSTSSTRRRTS